MKNTWVFFTIWNNYLENGYRSAWQVCFRVRKHNSIAFLLNFHCGVMLTSMRRQEKRTKNTPLRTVWPVWFGLHFNFEMSPYWTAAMPVASSALSHGESYDSYESSWTYVKRFHGNPQNCIYRPACCAAGKKSPTFEMGSYEVTLYRSFGIHRSCSAIHIWVWPSLCFSDLRLKLIIDSSQSLRSCTSSSFLL